MTNEKSYEEKQAERQKKAEIMAIKDADLRIQAIRENGHLFNGGKSNE